MKLNKRELGSLLAAIEYATQWESEFIDAHRIHYARGRKEKVVPAEYRPLVRKSKALIAAWQKLRRKIKETICPPPTDPRASRF